MRICFVFVFTGGSSSAKEVGEALLQILKVFAINEHLVFHSTYTVRSLNSTVKKCRNYSERRLVRYPYKKKKVLKNIAVDYSRQLNTLYRYTEIPYVSGK